MKPKERQHDTNNETKWLLLSPHMAMCSESEREKIKFYNRKKKSKKHGKSPVRKKGKVNTYSNLLSLPFSYERTITEE